jgi:hypothetical protein
MSDTYPLGFRAAEADWNHLELKCPDPRPYTLELWNQLTMGEQAKYGAEECKTQGAIYTSEITGDSVSMTVALPTSLVPNGFSEKEARWIEDALHKKFEETIHWILVTRQNGWNK